MSEDSQRLSRLQDMIEDSSAGLLSYESPFGQRQGYENMGKVDEEVDLADSETLPSHSHPSPTPVVSNFEGHSTEPTLHNPMDSVGPRKSKFQEIFRTLSSRWRKDGSSQRLLDVGENCHNPNELHPNTEYKGASHLTDMDDLSKKYSQVPTECHSRYDVHIRRWSWLYIWQLIMSIVSTGLSGIALALSIQQKRWGRTISNGNEAVISPGTAMNRAQYFYKAIEVTFVAVFVTFVGQILTRRAFSKTSKAINIAEMTIRNWISQPGSIFTNWEGLPHTGFSLLGALTLLGSLAIVFHSTACTVLITPKLLWTDWHQHGKLYGPVRTSYANVEYVKRTCPTTGTALTDPDYDARAAACLDVQFSGNSYTNLLPYLRSWRDFHDSTDLKARPNGTALLFGNTTLVSSWLDDGQPVSEVAGRIINNVTLAMPHAGVSGIYAETFNDTYGILQPSEFQGGGAYEIQASVVSPAINVMCVNAAKSELSPLINATSKKTAKTTSLDEVFHWGGERDRYRPSFPMFPINYNIITDTQDYVPGADSIYLLGKSNSTGNYTLCQLRSFTTPDCSTHFNVSGTSGSMEAHCQDSSDANTYRSSSSDAGIVVSTDWRNLAVEWRLSMDINGGVTKNNASNARILTDMVLLEPKLQPGAPSLAEALAVFAGSTLVAGSLGSTYRHSWDYAGNDSNILPAPGLYEEFGASYRTMQYTSTYYPGQLAAYTVFCYAVLAIVFAINLLCLVYHLCRTGMVTDFTEPRNLFTLAINSPPSRCLQGACGRGPEFKDQGIPFRVVYAQSANHYYFEDARDAPARLAAKRISKLSTLTTGSQAALLADGSYSNSYKRLSSKQPLL